MLFGLCVLCRVCIAYSVVYYFNVSFSDYFGWGRESLFLISITRDLKVFALPIGCTRLP